MGEEACFFLPPCQNRACLIVDIKEEFGDFLVGRCYLASLFTFVSAVGLQWPQVPLFCGMPVPTRRRCPPETVVRFHPEGKALVAGEEGLLAALF